MTVDALEMDIYRPEATACASATCRSTSPTRARRGGKPLELVRYQLLERRAPGDARARRGHRRHSSSSRFPHQVRARPRRAHAARTSGSTRCARPRTSSSRSRARSGARSAPRCRSSASTGPTRPTAPDVGARPERLRSEGRDRSRRTARSAAGEPMDAARSPSRTTASSRSTASGRRPRATTGYFDNKELIFGKIEPGQSKTANAPLGWCEVEGRKPGSTEPKSTNAPRVCKIPKDALSRSDGMQGQVRRRRRRTRRADAEIRTTVRALERPLFQYAYQIADNRSGNGDGRVQKGEARHHVPDGEEHRQGPLVRDAGQPRATSPATACSCTTAASTSRT